MTSTKNCLAACVIKQSLTKFSLAFGKHELRPRYNAKNNSNNPYSSSDVII